MRNKYSEDFRRNTVALIRSGYGIRNVANKLGISPTTIVHWTKDVRYMDVPPANPELFSQLPCGIEPPQPTGLQLVRIGDTTESRTDTKTGVVSIRFGKLRMEFRDGISKEMLETLIKALGESGVL